LLNPSVIGANALADFGEKMIYLIEAFDNEKLSEFASNLSELTAKFIEGKISSDEFFNSFSEGIENIDLSNLSDSDFEYLINDLLPSAASGFGNYLQSVRSAFNAGKIGSEDYRKAL
jgi:hypothetical protein